MKWGRKLAGTEKSASRPGRLVVLVSGAGTNMQAIAEACATGALAATVSAVIADRPTAGALQKATDAGITTLVVERGPGEERPAYDRRLADVVDQFQPDFVVLAGWMKLLSMNFLKRFPNRVVNLHPALPGQFPGTHSIERALQAAQRLGLNRTGVMVHFVADEGVDNGPIIATVEVPIHPADSLESLTERVHEAEHVLLVEALATVLATR